MSKQGWGLEFHYKTKLIVGKKPVVFMVKSKNGQAA